jgi:hypothetical protein
MIVRVSIDLTLIDKSRVKDAIRKNGKPAKFYDAVLFINDELDQYGQCGTICESVTLEEKNAGKKGTILGNLTPASKQAPKVEPAPIKAVVASIEADDDLPF